MFCLLKQTSFAGMSVHCRRCVLPVLSKGDLRYKHYPPKLLSTSSTKPHMIRRTFKSSSYLLKIVPFLLADIGEGIKEVVVKEWFVKVGDQIGQFQNVCEVQSDKASVTITSRYDGIVRKIYYEEEAVALVGRPLIDIETEMEGATVGEEVQEREAIAIAAAPEGSIDLPSVSSSSSGKVLTTPAVRRIAMEYKVDLVEVEGTGKDNRILKEDVLKFVEARERESSLTADAAQVKTIPTPVATTKPKESSPKPVQPRVVPVDLKGEDRVEPIKGYKKTMVKTMTSSMKIPHFGYCDEVDMSALLGLKDEFKSLSKREDVKLSLMPFFIKAASLALRRYPVLNSSLDEQAQNLTYKWSHNIGVAMDTEDGLVVPNIKNVQNLSILDIAREMQRLQSLGKKGSFSTKDVTGGTFTISNIGTIGGTYAKPLILAPEVAIGALGKIQKLPRYSHDGSITPMHLMSVSWSADHRVIDGATMARFSNTWKDMLQSPLSMLLYLK